MINTSCKYCVFKSMKDDQQVGCQLNRINKFKEYGTKIDKEENYLVIKDRFCLALRTEAWAKKQDNPLKKVREEITVQCDFIIYVDDTNVLNDIQCTVNTVVQQKIRPNTLRIIANANSINPNNIIDLLEEMLPSGLPFFVHNVVIRDKQGRRLVRNRCLDIAADKCDSTYYAVFNAGYEIPSTFLMDIDYRLNDELDRFCALEPNKSNNGMVVQTKLHTLLMGNRPVQFKDGKIIMDTIIKKVKFLSEEQNNRHMVKKVTEICQEM